MGMNLLVKGRFVRQLHASCSRAASTSTQPEIFDRALKRRQRDWAARQGDFHKYTYVKEELAFRAADRVYDCTRFFPVAVDLGAGLGWIAPHVFKENVGKLIQVEMSAEMSARSMSSDEAPTERIIADEETIVLADESVDLIITSTSMHWINDIPGFLKRCYTALRPDGAIIISMLGGDSLFELRCSLQLAEQERRGGVAQHISPFVKPSDIGALLSRAGFSMLTMDADRLVVHYPHMLAVMTDVQGMAEQAATWTRAGHLDRDVLLAAQAIYEAMYGHTSEERGATLPATFECVNAIAWKPGPLMPMAVARGSAHVSLKDLGTAATNVQKKDLGTAAANVQKAKPSDETSS